VLEGYDVFVGNGVREAVGVIVGVGVLVRVGVRVGKRPTTGKKNRPDLRMIGKNVRMVGVPRGAAGLWGATARAGALGWFFSATISKTSASRTKIP
jgi:hypothetical protein